MGADAFKDVGFMLKFVSWVFSIICLVLFEIYGGYLAHNHMMITLSIHSYVIILAALLLCTAISGKNDFFFKTFGCIGSVLHTGTGLLLLFGYVGSLDSKNETLVCIVGIMIFASGMLLLVAFLVDVNADVGRIFKSPDSIIKLATLMLLIASTAYLSTRCFKFRSLGALETFYLALPGGVLIVGILVASYIFGDPHRGLAMMLMICLAALNLACFVLAMIEHSSDTVRKSYCGNVEHMTDADMKYTTLVLGLLCLFNAVLMVIDVVLTVLQTRGRLQQ